MEFFYDSLSLRHKRPFGCLRQHESCQVAVEAAGEGPLLLLELLITCDAGGSLAIPLAPAEERGGRRVYRGEFALPLCGLYFYHFRALLPDSPVELFRDEGSGVAAEQGDLWQITCFPEDFSTPDRFQGTVMYQVFPDRFCREGSCDLTDKLKPFWVHDRWDDLPSYRPNEQGEVLNNDFFGGNFNGIRSKLPYLRSLSVDVLYLNPIGMAFSNHRYDTADYLRPDPMLGTEEDFAALCREAHGLGIKVILDGVYSHTGSNSVYFDRAEVFGNGAYHDQHSPYYSWYDFKQWPDEYDAWWGFKTLPNVRELDPSYLDFIVRGEDSVIAHWLRLGADGFRLDVADELPDQFIAAFRARLKQLKPDALLIGEVWEDASNKISYGVRRKYFTHGELDSVMNYPFRTAILDLLNGGQPEAFRRAVMTIVENYPAGALHSAMNSLSTHDTPRILSLLGAGAPEDRDGRAVYRLPPDELRRALDRERAAAVLQFTLPGCPCIYYGDEAGLEGLEDPFNRRCYPWGGENTELLEFYRALARLKGDIPALKTGDISFPPAPPGLLCYVRRRSGRQVRVLLCTGAPRSVPLRGTPRLLCGGRQENGRLLLEQWGAAIIEEEECTVQKVCFGVDIGGTSVKLGLVSEDGALLKKEEFPSQKQQDAMFDEIARHIADILAQFPDAQCVGAGVGVPGPVLGRARVQGCVNLGWGDVEVAEELSSRISLPVLVENDANLAALGEMWQGAGQGHRDLVMLTVGTGIGAGVIADGRIISGAVGAGGEVGHIPMDCHTDWQCSCGKYGCLEVTASATGIIRAAREYAPFRDMERVTAKDVFDAAKDGHADALHVVTEAGRCLGTAAAAIGCVVNPEVFVIGGGVSAAGRLLLDPVEAAYQEWVFAPARGARFILAQLGNNAGIYGGAGLFFCGA